MSARRRVRAAEIGASLGGDGAAGGAVAVAKLGSGSRGGGGGRGRGHRGDMAMGALHAGAAPKPREDDDTILIDSGSSLPALKSIARPLDTSMRRSDLVPVRTIGVGTFGRVRMVRDKRDRKLYALKTLRKATVVRLRQQRNVCYEKAVLAAIRHPFLIQLQAAF